MHPSKYYNVLIERLGVKEYLFPYGQNAAEVERAFRTVISEQAPNLPPETLEAVRQQFMRGSAPVIEALTAGIIEVLPQPSRQKLEHRIYVGEFPTGDFNAQAVREPAGDGYVFLINKGLMMLVNTVVKIVLSQATWASRDDAGCLDASTVTDSPALTNQEAATYLADTIKQYLSYGRWRPTSGHARIVLSGGIGMMQAMLTHYTELFVLAHEFGHALLGHLEGNSRQMLALPGGGQAIEVISKSVQDEFAADYTAGFILLTIAGRESSDRLGHLQKEMALAAPFLFFEIGRLLEEASQTSSTTHPRCQHRSEQISRLVHQAGVPANAQTVADTVVQTIRFLATS